jgi:formylmethanofuran dehydrogenase subunit E
MAHHCDFCGEKLSDEEEEKSEVIGKQVCRDCLHGGIELLKTVLGRRE